MQNQSTALPSTSGNPSGRRLLPAIAPQHHIGGLPRPAPVLPRKKAHSAAACETCRKRKVKCNAARPACSYCVSTSSDCVYRTSTADETHSQALKRKLSEFNERETTYLQVFEHLRDRPDAEAADILKRIRAGTSPASILRYIREGDLLLQLALAPETRYRYVFPLVQDMPKFLVRPDNPYLNSWVYDWKTTGLASSQGSSNSTVLRHVELQSTYTKPYHTAELIDPLINSVRPSEWTTVSSDDFLMRKMLANYILSEHNWFPAFQKDYFLQDMAAGRRSCCSSLLVNTVLAMGSMVTASFPNRYEYWNPRNYSYQFLAEATRLWEAETLGRKVRLTTIQAAPLLHLIAVLNGKDGSCAPYTRQAVDMAQRFGLFSPDVSRLGVRMRDARAFTAWALFNWQSMISYAHFAPPLLESPPAIPLPDPSANPDWYGQVWVRYPGDPKLYTTHFPHQFKAQSIFRSIINEASLDKSRVDKGEGWTPAAALPAIDRLHSRLRAWYDDLPAPLTPAEITLPSQLMLHIFYHNIIINLYEPLCTPDANFPPSASRPSPTQIRDASARHIETLLRLYYLRHGYDQGDTYIGKCLVQLGFMTLKRIATLPAAGTTQYPDSQSRESALRTLHSTLLLVATGLQAQGASYFLDKAILRTLKGKMLPAEQKLLGQVIGDIEVAEPEVKAQMKNVRSKVLPSAISLRDDPEVHRLGAQLEKLALGEGEKDSQAGEE